MATPTTVRQSCVDLGNVRERSAACLTDYGRKVWHGKSAEDWGVALGEKLGCPTSPDGKEQLAALRKVSAEQIIAKSWDAAAMDCYEPCVE